MHFGVRAWCGVTGRGLEAAALNLPGFSMVLHCYSKDSAQPTYVAHLGVPPNTKTKD